MAFSKNGAWPGNYPRHTATTRGITRRVYSILQPEHGTTPIIYMNLKISIMFVTIKSKDGYDVDVTSLYLKAMMKEISVAHYQSQLDTIANSNKNV